MRNRRIIVAAAMAFLVASAVPVTPVSALPSDGFYVPPDPLPPGQPGDVIRSRSIVAPAFPGAADVSHVLYRSSDVNGAPIAVSGTVFVPRAGFDGPRPVVVLTPATRGTPDKCAPSKQYEVGSSSPDAADAETPIVSQLLSRGIVVAVTDYQGQGTPGLTSYLVGRPAGYAGLDILRAAQRLPDTGLSKDGPVGIAGYSQGGQAAGWAAELQPEYAPELNLKGVALGGVPTDINVVAAQYNGGRGAGFLFAALSGVDFAYPDLGLDETYLTANGRAVMAQIREQDCISAWYFLKKFDGHSTSEITEPDVLTLPAWRRRFAESTVGTKPLRAPAYLYHGTADELVPFSQFQRLATAGAGRAQPSSSKSSRGWTMAGRSRPARSQPCGG